MKVRFIGTGTFGSLSRALTSILINDEVLFDAGGGTVRGMQNYETDMTKIKYVIITHFHIDHWLDLPNLLMRRCIAMRESEWPLIIVGPKDTESVVSESVKFCMGSIKYLNDAKFIELVDDSVQVGKYEILAHSLVHSFTDDNRPVNGYEVAIDECRLGFSGDSGKCDNLDTIVERSDVLFLDATFSGQSDDSHLNLGSIIEYAKQYPDKKFYAIHRGDYEIPNLPKNVYAPNDGEEVEI